MKNWYLVVQEKAPGSPLGYTDVVLSDRFRTKKELESIGHLPWYAGPHDKSARLDLLPASGLVIISSDKRYKFDLRSIGGYERIFAMSGRCFDVLQELETNFSEISTVDFVDSENRPLSSRSYHVARTKRMALAEVTNKDGSTRFQCNAGRVIVEKLDIADHVSLDIFTLADLPTTQDSLICSENFRQAAKASGLKGIGFLDLKTVRWPKPPGPDDMTDLLKMLTAPESEVMHMI